MRGKPSNSQLNKPHNQPWETEAIRMSQQGARESFTRLADHYKDWVFTLIYRWVGQKEVAEEMAQEVFIKAFSRIRTFRGEAKFSSWLYQITQNRCRDYWRSPEYRRGQALPLESVLEKPALSPGAEEALGQAQREGRVRRALESLPQDYREALMLRYLHELSYQEMSQQLNQGISSLKMRVLRGLKLLKSKLDEMQNES